eukprot:774305-Rhodomonas_salina.1
MDIETPGPSLATDVNRDAKSGTAAGWGDGALGGSCPLAPDLARHSFVLDSPYCARENIRALMADR